MQCLKCGKGSVLHSNAYDVSDAGGCTIKCSACGQPHDGNLIFDTQTVRIPMTVWQNAFIYGCIVAALAAAYGITLLF